MYELIRRNYSDSEGRDQLLEQFPQCCISMVDNFITTYCCAIPVQRLFLLSPESTGLRTELLGRRVSLIHGYVVGHVKLSPGEAYWSSYQTYKIERGR